MEEVGEAMGDGAGLVFPGGRIAPAHRFCFLHVVVLHLYPTNCGGFNGSNGAIKFEQSGDAYQVSQGRTMGQLKPLKIIPSYRFYTISIISEIQTHLVVS